VSVVETPVVIHPPRPTIPIPVDRYRTEEFHGRELDRLWSRTWQLACLDTDLPEAGSWLTYEIGSWSVLIVRDADDGLRAFHNACPHRGRQIRESGCGTSAKIRCAYHGWSWTLDGALAEVPEREQFVWDDVDLGLLPVRVETFGRWVCVNLDPGAPTLAATMAPIADLLEPYALATQHRWKAHATVVNANWKNIMDAFNEAYHARSIHNESHSFINYVDYELGLVGDHSFMVIPFGIPDAYVNKVEPDFDDMLDAMKWSFGAFGEDTTMVDIMRDMAIPEGGTLQDLMRMLIVGGMAQNNIDISALSESQITDDWHFMIFPNIIINSFSFGHWLFRVRPFADDPTRSHFDIWYFHQTPVGMSVPDAPVIEMANGDPELGAVVLQDVHNIELQQLGHNSPSCPDLRIGGTEARIVHFNDVLDRYLSD
jgi:nitrite reductase/ring-hydroxylating ferredoxin subunit